MQGDPAGRPTGKRVVRWASRAPPWPRRGAGLGESCLGPGEGPGGFSVFTLHRVIPNPSAVTFSSRASWRLDSHGDPRSLVGQGGLRVPTLD